MPDHGLNEFGPCVTRFEACRLPGESGGPVFYRGYELTSAFQPVLGIRQGRLVGYEALLRPRGAAGNELPPLALFDMARGFDELAKLNQLATELHLAKFAEQDPGNCWLFLNLNLASLHEFESRPGGLKAEVTRYGLSPERVVIEVMESDLVDDDTVSGLLLNYRRAGFLLAIDDFGSGFSNLGRILALKPEIVKFDRELMRKRLSDPAMTRVFEHLAASLREVNIMVLAEGVETIDDAQSAMNANFDMLQGYWLARPNAAIEVAHLPEQIRLLRDTRAQALNKTDENVSEIKSLTISAMARAASVYSDTGDFDAATRIFLELPWARRFWIADDRGMEQQSRNRRLRGFDAENAKKLAPLQPGPENCMIHRRYFHDAINRPDQIHFAGPYSSVLDGTRVFAVARGLMRDGRMQVLCATVVMPMVFDL